MTTTVLISSVLFVIGLVLVVKGGDMFVDAASWIAKALGVPSFIIGATIVSIATTLPELIVSVIAAAEGKNDMAVGNAVGSVTANTAMILAIAMLCMHIECKRSEYMKMGLILIASVTALAVACFKGSMTLAGCVVLIIVFLFFMVSNVQNAKKMTSTDGDREQLAKKDVVLNLIKFVVAAAMIVGGSQLLVNSGSDLATIFGVPERVIAVTLVAIGTSLPELVTTITAIVKKESGLSIGNVIGANIIDLTLIMPVCSIVSGQALPISKQAATFDIPVCLGITVIAIVPMLIREKASKFFGALLLLAYAGYLYMVIA